jgi:uncharacterized protein (DUF433 family)
VTREVAVAISGPFLRISIDSGVCHGQACVKGTRIPVHQVVRMLANGDTVGELLAEYRSLTRSDVLACLEYAATLAEQHITPDSDTNW